MHRKSLQCYIVDGDMTIAGKNVKLTEAVVVVKSLTRILYKDEYHESKDSLSMQQMTNHSTQGRI